MDKIIEIKKRLADRKRTHSETVSAVASLQRKADLIAAEVRGLESALQILEPDASPSYDVAGQATTAINQVTRKRGLREHWKRIFNDMITHHPDGASYNDIMPLVAADGSTMTAPALRTQMMLFAQQGIVERVSHGVFKVTEAGKLASTTKISSPPAETGENLSLLGD
jgi:hypothetical protein